MQIHMLSYFLLGQKLGYHEHLKHEFVRSIAILEVTDTVLIVVFFEKSSMTILLHFIHVEVNYKLLK